MNRALIRKEVLDALQILRHRACLARWWLQLPSVLASQEPLQEGIRRVELFTELHLPASFSGRALARQARPGGFDSLSRY